MLKTKALFIILNFIMLSFISAQIVWADDSQLLSMVQDLQKQMGQMQKTIDRQNQKISQMDNGPTVTAAPSATGEPIPMSDKEFEDRLALATGGANKWLKDLSFKGDLRLRYESFSNSAGALTETDDRNRFRYRLRFGWEKKFSPEMKAGFALASGEQAFGTTTLGDNVSTNTTFDSNFAGKQVNITKAYAAYSPNFAKIGPVKNLTIVGGKQDNLFEKGSTDIIWDGDVTPEGLTETMDFAVIDTPDFLLGGFFTAGQFVLDEDSAVGGDAELFAYQLGLKSTFPTPLSDRAVEWLGATSYYSWNDYATKSNFLVGGTSLARGNFNIAGAATELDAVDFEVWEVYNEFKVDVMGKAFKPYFDYALNTANARVGNADSYGWALGLKIGGVKKKGDWELGYAYKRIGSEMTPGFNDSDFGFAGHSGKRGSVIKAGYGLTDTISFNAAAFFVNNLNAGTGTVLDEEQRRFQLDLIWKF